MFLDDLTPLQRRRHLQQRAELNRRAGIERRRQVSAAVRELMERRQGDRRAGPLD